MTYKPTEYGVTFIVSDEKLDDIVYYKRPAWWAFWRSSQPVTRRDILTGCYDRAERAERRRVELGE